MILAGVQAVNAAYELPRDMQVDVARRVLDAAYPIVTREQVVDLNPGCVLVNEQGQVASPPMLVLSPKWMLRNGPWVLVWAP
jgi:hypothetical protein